MHCPCGSVTFEARRSHTVQERLYLTYQADGSCIEDDPDFGETEVLSDFTFIRCAECERSMPLPETPYTVLLLYPLAATDGEVEPFLAHVQAATPAQAVALARCQVRAGVEAEYAPAAFRVLLVLEGSHIDRQDQAPEEVITVACKFCRNDVPAITAHQHQGAWVGDACCWDERLRATA